MLENMNKTYFINRMFGENEIDNILKILTAKNINTLYIDLYFNINNWENEFSNFENFFIRIPETIENIILFPQVYPLFLSNPAKKIKIDNLHIYIKNIFINDDKLFYLKSPFGCDVININDSQKNNDIFSEFRKTIKPYLH